MGDTLTDMPGAFAYDPFLRWTFYCKEGGQDHLARSSKGGTYLRPCSDSLQFASQMMVAAILGFTHAFFASLFPFVAEEVGAELCLFAASLDCVRRWRHARQILRWVVLKSLTFRLLGQWAVHGRRNRWVHPRVLADVLPDCLRGCGTRARWSHHQSPKAPQFSGTGEETQR